MSDWNKVPAEGMTLSGHMTTVTSQNDAHEEYKIFVWLDCV